MMMSFVVFLLLIFLLTSKKREFRLSKNESVDSVCFFAYSSFEKTSSRKHEFRLRSFLFYICLTFFE